MSSGRQTRIFLIRTALQLILIFGRLVSPEAAEFTVNSGYDQNDLEPGNGLCVAYIVVFPPFVLPFCTLRGAIEEANALPGLDIITLQSGYYLLEIEGINEDVSATGDLDITDNLIIRGAGPKRTYLDGNGLDRVVDIIGTGTKVTMEKLAIINGSLPATLAAGHQGGGGARNQGTLTLRQVGLANNQVQGSASGNAGGGILNMANCVLVQSTVSSNHAASGGGLYNASGGTLTVWSSTINNNDSLSGGGITNEGSLRMINATVSSNRVSSGRYPFGGGIFNASEMEILQSTITANSTPGGPGGGLSNEGRVRLTNTIIAGNTNTDCYLGKFLESGGTNLTGDKSCHPGTGTDIIADPLLANLQDHGGPTMTHGLLIGSPAVDRGQNLSSIGITADQRGIRRPDGSEYDIGAFETRKRSIVPFIIPLLDQGS